MSTITYTGTLTVISCWCGIEFAVPRSLYDAHRYDRSVKSIYCPLGHWAEWGREQRESDHLRRQLRGEEARRIHAEDQRLMAERSARALRGHLTRLRNRIAAGVCPWCHRHFSNVQRHVEGQHPDRTEKMREALS